MNIDNNTYILKNLNTLEYLDLLPPEVITTNQNYISLYLEPYFYNYPMYENTVTQLVLKNLNNSEIYNVYNGPFTSNLTINDSRIVYNNYYRIKRLIKHDQNILRESNYSNIFSISIPETTTPITYTTSLNNIITTNILTTIPINNNNDNDNDDGNDDGNDNTWIILV